MRRAFLAILLWLPSVAHAQGEGPTLLFGGDVIFDDPIDYALRQMHRSRDEAASYEGLFADLSLSDADLTIVNLETPVAERVRSREDGIDLPVFAAPRAFLEALAHAGVDAVTLANNHAYDQGVGGLAATLQSASALGVSAIGVGADRASAHEARILTARGRRIAIVSATQGVNLSARSGEPSGPRVALFDEAMLRGAIAAARGRSDLTIAVLHWTDGAPGEALPTDEMTSWCTRAAEAGADLVVGHGPHVPGPRATIHTADGRDVVVLYSLGNLIAAMRAGHDELALERASVRDAVLASIHTRVSGARLVVASIEARPFFIAASRRDASRFVRPLAMDAEIARAEAAACGRECAQRAAAFVARRARIAALFGTSTSASTSTTASTTTTTTASTSTTTTSTSTSTTASTTTTTSTTSPEGELFDLGLAFSPGSARETAHDEAHVRALAERMRADHGTRVVIVAHPATGESRSVAERRAHHARGLLSVLGPSRARFTLLAGAPEPRARVEVRLVRATGP